MKLTFWGAAGEVTGSCSLLESDQTKLLVDCGMFQGGDFNESRNSNPLPFNPVELSAVFVTHAVILAITLSDFYN
jgi:metallo-beta-lactamase family protein